MPMYRFSCRSKVAADDVAVATILARLLVCRGGEAGRFSFKVHPSSKRRSYVRECTYHIHLRESNGGRWRQRCVKGGVWRSIYGPGMAV